jgi:hypothetical protein
MLISRENMTQRAFTTTERESVERLPQAPVPPATETEELAQVVIAKESQENQAKPWYLVLRPWLFCLLFLALAEIGARLYFDLTLCLQKERFDNFPGPAFEDTYVQQMARDKAFRVVVIGDSTVVGPSLLQKDQTMPMFLEKALQRAVPGREIHVWNLSIAGARASDQYCLLLKALEAKPDFVVVMGNYYISGMNLSLIPLYYPWLARSLPEVPGPIRPLLETAEAVQQEQEKRNDYQEKKFRREDALTDYIEKRVRLIGMRQAINAKLFGVQPRVPFESPNPVIMEGVHVARSTGHLAPEPWYRRGIEPVNFAAAYAVTLTPDNLNGKFYRLMADELARRHLPAFTYQTPQNPELALDKKKYAANRRMMASFFAAPGIPHGDYSDLVPSGLFHDNDHMLAEGNKMLADAIAAQIAPRIARQAGK